MVRLRSFIPVSYTHLDVYKRQVLHKQNPMGYSFDADAGYIAYADSTENAANNNGVIYICLLYTSRCV